MTFLMTHFCGAVELLLH